MVEGVVDRVTFASEDSAFAVVRVTVAGRREPVVAVGDLAGVQPGETLRLRGRFALDRRFGEQLQVRAWLSVLPATLAGIERYLGSGLVPGIGKAMAERLVARFGLATLDVIDGHPERLTEVEGIGRVRSERIRGAWSKQRHVREVMVFLQSHGVSTAHAARIFKQYGERAVAVVRADPYRLAVDVHGIGFRTADALAAKLGLAGDAPQRVQAGVLHALGELADEGHVGQPRDRLVEVAAALLGVDGALVERAVDALVLGGALVVEPVPRAPDAVFLARLHAAETELARDLGRLAKRGGAPIEPDVDRALAWLEAEQRFALAPEQRDAVRRATTSRLLVVTGGPGTGKTTLVRGIVRIVEKRGARVALAAPTGRAAKRMQEATGREAKTIHRLLEYDPRAGGFGRDAGNPLDCDLLVVDEASMLDVELARDLVRALGEHARLVLVGDVDQLPSVGPGTVLADLIASGAVDVVRLARIFRQGERSLIVENAHRIRAGELPEIGDARRDGDFFFFERSEPEQVLATIEKLVTERIPAGFGLDPVEDVQVLTPMHKGLLGATSLNAALQARLNPAGASVSRGARTFRVGDKVMQTRNDYDRDVFNGDVGRVAAIDEGERTVVVRIDGRDVVYEPDDLDDLALAYAVSVHKSQGSEYPCVVLPLHTQHFVMLRRNLLYTAVTRGKRLVVIVGTRRALELAVRNAEGATGAPDARGVRYGRLADRLRASAAGG